LEIGSEHGKIFLGKSITKNLMKRKCKILFTVSEFMYSSKVRRLFDLVSYIDRSVFEIEIGALALGNEATEDIKRLNVPFFLLKTVPQKDLSLNYIRKFLISPFIILRKKYDLVHSLLYQSVLTEPAIIKVFSRAKYIYTKSNIQWENHNFNWYWKSKLADGIISISRATDNLLFQKGFESKTVKIPNGIDVNYFKISNIKRNSLRSKWGISPETFVFGCAAQFIKMKQHILLIEAFEKVNLRFKNTALFLCGPHHNDDYYESILNRIKKSPCRSRIFLLGTISDMPSFYSAIDLLILPSVNEPFGYVLIEAMSCNRPVIADPSGGPMDIIVDGENGFFARMLGNENLANRMVHYLENKDMLKQHGISARKRVLNLFSREITVQNHEKLYLEMLGLN